MNNFPLSVYNSFEGESFAQTLKSFCDFFTSTKKHILICAKNVGYLESLEKLFLEHGFNNFKYAKSITEISGQKTVFLCQMDITDENQFEAENLYCYYISSLLGKK